MTYLPPGYEIEDPKTEYEETKCVKDCSPDAYWEHGHAFDCPKIAHIDWDARAKQARLDRETENIW